MNAFEDWREAATWAMWIGLTITTPAAPCLVIWLTVRTIRRRNRKRLPEGLIHNDWRRAGHFENPDGSITLAKDR